MSKRRFDSVWDAIKDTPQEAVNLKVRSELMIAISEGCRRPPLEALHPLRGVAPRF